MATPVALPSTAEPPDARVAPHAAVLGAIALGGVAAAAVSVALALRSDHVSEPGVRAVLVVWVILPYVLAGVVAWWRRPDSRFGPLLVAAGYTFFLSSISTANWEIAYTIGIAFDLLPAVLFLHVFLAFPSGRLESRTERALVAIGYFAAFGLQLVGMALGGFGPDSLLELTSKPGTAHSLLRVQLAILAACALIGIGVLAARRRTAGPPLRRSLALLIDSFALGLLMIAFLLLSGALGLVEGQPAFENIRRTTFFVIGLAPFAFLVGLLDARLARTSVGELFVELQTDPAPAELRDALARALREPSLELVYWLPEFGSYADIDARDAVLPSEASGRATTLIEVDGVRVAALIHDPSLQDEPELLDAVTAAAAIALENARLHVELRARLEGLAGSRARVIEAGQKERQQLERNLHDGAQQRLITLSLELRSLEGRLGEDPDARRQLEGAQREISMSLEELRAVARGIHPAVLTGHGLAVALEHVAARAPVPVRLTVDVEERVPEPVEVAAYYVVTESLANVAKHAQATTAKVEVDRADDELVVEVVDDGVGGADSERGSGLRGLADRVEALGGRLRVWTPRGGGTRVRAEIPCG
jgi:signal transduction histidine kinase